MNRWLPYVVRAAIGIFALYVGLTLVFALFQRSLIYLPAREGRIEPRHAGLSAGQVHTITLQTADGLELRGWHLLPQEQTADSAEDCERQLATGRLVLFFSGNGGNRSFRTEECRALTDCGVHVFLFDYRGYGDNPGSPSEERLAADAHAIWDYATQQRHVAAGRIVLYGESLGGGVAVRLAAELCQAGTPPAALILRSTFSSLVDVAAYHYPWLPVRLALVDRFPSTDRIPRVTCPLLQFHGGSDTIVPLEFGQRLLAAAPAASTSGMPKRWVEFPQADHNDVLWVAGEEFSLALNDFLTALR